MLNDALILDPWRDPHEVWISARTDQLGSGTQADPFSGGTHTTPIVSVALNWNADTPYALQVTAFQPVDQAPHSYGVGDLITFSGATDPAYNGAFAIESVSMADPRTFNVTLRSQPAGDPAGSPTCCKTLFLFDQVMRSLPANTVIHIGPGTFETQGEGEGVPVDKVGWRVLNGWRIVGSGIGTTILKLVGAYLRNKHYSIIGAENSQYLADGLEARDLTLDCNVDGQAGLYVAAGGVTLRGGGRNIRLQRLRAINCGSKAPDGYVENFVIALAGNLGGTADTFGAVIEDCIVEQPGHNNYWNSTFMGFGGTEDQHGPPVPAYVRGCVLRNNFVDARYDYGPKVPIQSISVAADIVSVTTRLPHGKTMPGNILVSGVEDENHNISSNPCNGVFALESADTPTTLTYKINASVAGAPSGGTVGGRNSSLQVAIANLSVDQATGNVIITTQEPHFRTPNNNVKLDGVLNRSDNSVSTVFNGIFPVVAYSPPYELQCKVPTPNPDASDLKLDGALVNVLYQALVAEPGTACLVQGNRIAHCEIGTPYQDTFSSRDLVVRDNYYHDVVIGPFENRFSISRYLDGIALKSLQPVSAPSTTAEATTDLAHGLQVGDRITISGADVPNYNTDPKAPGLTVAAVTDSNKFQYTANGPLSGPASQGYYQVPELLRPLKSLTRQQGNAKGITGIMAAIGGSQEHGLEKGDAIRIIHAGQWDTVAVRFIPNSKYNGNWAIDSVDTDNQGIPQFHFTVDADPGFDADGTPNADGTTNSAGFFGRIWQLKRLTIENNVIELAVRKPSARSVGVFMFCSRDYIPYFLVRQVMIRGNAIRFVDNAADPAQLSTGIELQYTQNALVQDNVIRMALSNAIQYFDPTTGTGVRTFNNWTPTGQMIQAIRQVDGIKAPDVGSQFRDDLDAAILGLF